MKTLSKENLQFKVRLDDDLLSWLKERAKANRRSMTAEINVRLLESREREEKADAEKPA